MTIKARYILLAVLIISVAILILQLSSRQEKFIHKTAVNEKIVQTRSFSVSSDSTDLNTSAKGTLFIKGDKGIPEHIQIVASISIDPKDWGGVAFNIPDKWYISNITSSYPEKETKSIPADYITTLTTADTENKWRAIIEVGRGRDAYKSTGDGTGTVVIDLVSDKKAIQESDKFSISVAVGSDEKDGVKIVGPDYVEIPISLTDMSDD
ncbi:hypothetical protein MHH56_28340 [Paenibacillus sp. FSL K6-3182]|uniref:hypothetical protein n=1 Tax=unclassified Paenibacillus TaxID=185978 RepID=UPI0030CED8C2